MALSPRKPVVIRQVHLPDAQAMREFLNGGLSAGSRRNRFHGAVASVSPDLLARLVAADGIGHAAWVACVWGEHGEEIVGEAVWYLVDEERHVAELAISVHDDWHGTGVAHDMMRTLVQAARDAGVRELYGDVLHGNGRMLAFMRKHGMEPGICEPPEDRDLVRVGCMFPARDAAAEAAKIVGWRARLASLWS